MPVATLRVWERRYGLTQPMVSPSGQRQYSDEDVRRLALIKQLNDQGHAIGSLAALDIPQLQQVAATHAQALATTQRMEVLPQRAASSAAPWRIAVVGEALGLRLQRPALMKRLGRPALLVGVFGSVAQAAVALSHSAMDVLLLHEPQLQPGWLASLEKSAPAFASVPKAVLYGFASEATCDDLAASGVALMRDPQPDAVLMQWLRGLAAMDAAALPVAGLPELSQTSVPPRRWDDSTLAHVASQSSSVACECPRQVATLLAQLAHFEAYSAACENRNAADASLHAYLRHVSASSRVLFEGALERVAAHEGLILTPPAGPRRL